METIPLSVTLVNSLLQYLGSKPFAEVVNLINEIQKEAQAAKQPPAVASEP